MVILATEGLTKNFGGLRATDSIDLAIEEGKLTSLIGPNGAGKTTLFDLITGMIRPDAGKIIFRGERCAGLPVYQIVRRGISRSFQIINLFNELPLYDNVWLGVQAQQGHGPEVLSVPPTPCLPSERKPTESSKRSVWPGRSRRRSRDSPTAIAASSRLPWP